MIVKAGAELRGQRLSGLVWYLFSPGKEREHVDPRVVAAWANVDDVTAPLGHIEAAGAGRDLRAMATRMQMPLRAMCEARRPAKPVWHCIVRNHRDDPHLSDAQWAEIAEQVIGAVGLEGTRWVAVRHDDDGIHLAAVLATEDGRVPRLSWEINKLDALRRRLEPRYCTVRTGTTRTGDRRPTRAEHEKAKRQGRAEPARTTLRRAVNVAAIAAASDADFLAHLGKAGIIVETRRSVRDPRQITGYKVALPGHRTGEGEVIWYSGRCLGADMTWPKLATRWTLEPAPAAQPPTPRPQTETAAYVAARRSLREMQSMLRTHPHLAIDLQSPIADVSAALGNAWNGHHDGRRHQRMTAATDVADRAGRSPHRGARRCHLGTAQRLRSIARAIALGGRVAAGDNREACLLVVHQLVSTLEALGEAQCALQRADQAAAAHRSATALRLEIESLRRQRPAMTLITGRTHPVGRAYDHARRSG